LQLQYEHRLSRGLKVTGAFTWSKTLDDGFGNLDRGAAAMFRSVYGLWDERGLSNQSGLTSLPHRFLTPWPGSHTGCEDSDVVHVLVGQTRAQSHVRIQLRNIAAARIKIAKAIVEGFSTT